MAQTNKQKASRELWRGHGVVIGIYEHGFTVSDVCKVPRLNAQGTPNKNAGTEVLKDTTYYPKLCGAMENAANRVAASEADNLREYVDTYQCVANELAQATRGQ